MRSKLIKIIRLIMVILFIFITSISYSDNSNQKSINILTWWGYFSSPWISKIVEEQCHANISYDEYYTNDDFMHKFHEYKDMYDIIIFPDIDYNAIKNDLKNISSINLYKNAAHYQNTIKNNYYQNKYYHNIAYFLLSFNGFLYNPKILKINDNDDIYSVFKKAKDKIVVLSDEPIYVYNLLGQDYNNNPDLEKIFSQFNEITKNAKLCVTNQMSPVYNNPNFAFAYTWPGIALYIIDKQNLEYNYIIHPKMTLVSADLIASMNNRSTTQCVSNLMTSNDFISKMQNDTFYFSPYGDSDKINNQQFLIQHKKFFSSLPKLKWFQQLSSKQYNELYTAWAYHLRLKKN